MNKVIDLRSFARLVRRALVALYDYACLETSPLTDLLLGDLPQAARGSAVHRLLIQSIEEMKPASVDPNNPAIRRYQYLYLRYVDVRSIADVGSMLGVGLRQARRYHHEALDTLASRLYEIYLARNGGRLDDVPPHLTFETPPITAEAERIEATDRASHTDIGEALASVIETLAPLAAHHGATLRLACSTRTPRIAAERSLIRQILISAIGVTLVVARGDEITVACETQTQTVAINLRFFANRADLERSQAAARLSVCRNLLALVHGRLGIWQDGTTGRISLVLPAASAATVLVVDDNPDVRQLFRRYLTGESYDVLEASEFATALALAREIRPDVITLDVMLPGRDGWELLQHLKHDARCADIPVIVCSVLSERDLAFALGASEFLEKPATPAALFAAISRHRRSRPGRPPPAYSEDRALSRGR